MSEELEPSKYSENILGNQMTFVTDPNLFSPKHLDFGSKFLLENLVLPKSGNIVDLGCGYGAMGISIAKANPNLFVYLVDDNQEAVKCAKNNGGLNEVKNINAMRSNGLYLITKTRKISLIITNPPWHKMEETKDFVEQAFSTLSDFGEMWMVIRSEFKIQDFIVEIFGNCEEIGRQSPYKILKAVKDPGFKSLKKELFNILADNRITLDARKDQHILIDNKAIDKMINALGVNKKDAVLEIGCGTGFVTRELFKKAGVVTGIEIDRKFRPVLERIDRKVIYHFGNAWEIMHDKDIKLKYNKLISSVPYSLAEPLMHRHTHKPIDLMVFLLPIKFFEKIKNHCIFGAFFKIEKVADVQRGSFFPVPKTDSVIVKIAQLSKKLKLESVDLFVRRSLYEHEQALVKNTLRVVVEKLAKEFQKKDLTKNEARKIVEELGIEAKYLNSFPNTEDVYFKSALAIKSFFEKLS